MEGLLNWKISLFVAQNGVLMLEKWVKNDNTLVRYPSALVYDLIKWKLGLENPLTVKGFDLGRETLKL